MRIYFASSCQLLFFSEYKIQLMIFPTAFENLRIGTSSSQFSVQRFMEFGYFDDYFSTPVAETTTIIGMCTRP